MDLYRGDRIWRKFQLADHANAPHRNVTRKSLVGLGLISPDDYLDGVGKRFSIGRAPLARIRGLILSYQFVNQFDSHFVTITSRQGYWGSLQQAYLADTLEVVQLNGCNDNGDSNSPGYPQKPRE